MMVIRQSHGFTLVEVMVTLVVASLVVMAATTTFIVQNRMASIQSGTSDIQLTGQLTTELLSRDIRMAGYGVDKSTALVSLDNAPTTDDLRSVGTDAVQVRYSTPVLPSSPATTRGTRDYVYFIAKTGDGGLVRQDLISGGAAETIASNVEDMQLAVVDDAATGAKKVTLSLLLKSTVRDNEYAAAPPVIGNGIARPADNLRRRVYTVTINPRNYGM